ncbi:DUF2628 domain-containing protein [Ancylobacter terrae]|uniref:DUF2628 domain-containing protein n=1 Tax=Ancylobacter sp. sgz301288 TaxID=3342077 RepID=UPI00385A67AE
MGIWTVFEPDDERPGAAPSQSLRSQVDGIVFVREKFSWSALLFAPLVLIWHRLWLALFVYLLAQSLIGGVLAWYDITEEAGLAHLIPNLILAFELPLLRRMKLTRNFYDEVGTVVAPTEEDAERRFFDGWLPPSRAALRADERDGWPATSPASPVLGLFPQVPRR